EATLAVAAGSRAGRVLPQLELQRSPVHAQAARRLRDVSAAVGEHAADVLPLGPRQRRRLELLGPARQRLALVAGKGGDDVVGICPLWGVVGPPPAERPPSRR